MKNVICTVSALLFISLSGQAQTEGYSLEFEDVVTLSVESPETVAAGSSNTRTYTVPSNTVLKITSGCILASSTYYNCVLKIDNDEIVNKNLTASGVHEFPTIWAKTGSVITLEFNNTDTNPRECNCGFISGVLFRKVAN